jgi:hypothetical protein
MWFGRPDAFAREFTYHFIHPIIEFTDKSLFHHDKELIDLFVTRYMARTYLRKVLLTRDLTVQLPYRAGADELAYLREGLKTYLEMAADMRNPKIVLRAAA